MRGFLRSLLLLFVVLAMTVGCSGGSDTETPEHKKGNVPVGKPPGKGQPGVKGLPAS
jgi:hypothetical protein